MPGAAGAGAPPAASASTSSFSSLTEEGRIFWEQRSKEILTAIRCFVDGLRSAPRSEVGPLSATENLGTCKVEKPRQDDGRSLLMHLQSLGMIQIVQDLEKHQGALPNKTEEPVIPRAPEPSGLGSFLQNQYECDERKKIIRLMILPLLSKLGECYDILDGLPQTHQSQPTGDTQSKPQSQLKTPGNRRKNAAAAPPPLGMLSLNDYTNVACLLEFSISISLVPCLEYPTMYLPPSPLSPGNKLNNSKNMKVHRCNIKALMARRRIESLPRSLAGRISIINLTWGTICVAENHISLRDKLLEFCLRREDEARLCQLYHIYNTYQAYNEMTIFATSIGHLLLLDRFRPMLLSRHLSDIYLTLLISERLRWSLSNLDKYTQHKMKDEILENLMETEKLIERRTSERLHVLQKELFLSPLMFSSSLISPIANLMPFTKRVDFHEAALAYRTLLGGGASMIINGSDCAIPSWLRLRLGQCLTKLAKENLRPVVDVFVAYAFGPISTEQDSSNTNADVMAGAASRLALALCLEPASVCVSTTPKRNTNTFQEKLCSQFIEFLLVEVGDFIEEMKTNRGNGFPRSRSSMAMHFTLWACVSQMPADNLCSCFITKLVSGFMTEKVNSLPQQEKLTTFQSTAAIAVWFHTIPSSLDPLIEKRLQSLLLRPYVLFDDCDCTILGQLLRLTASFDSMIRDSALVVDISTQDEGDDKVFARLAETTLVQMIHILLRVSASDTESEHVIFGTLAAEMVKAVSANVLDKRGYCFVKGKAETNIDNISNIVGGVQDRAKCLVRSIVSLSKLDGGAMQNTEQVESSGILLAYLFRLVLCLHYSAMSYNCNERHGALECGFSKLNVDVLGLENFSTGDRDGIKMASTVLLSLICENIPPSCLLGTVNNQSDSGVLKMLGLIINSTALHIEETRLNSKYEDSEDLFSTASIVLSLLIALLEMGAQKRIESDESFFNSILPALHVISCGAAKDGSFQSPHPPNLLPELAEMASHAMALIGARGATVQAIYEKSSMFAEESELEAIFEKLSQAERDLQSTQPPLRAKGVVSLRHVARSLSGDENSCVNSDAIPMNVLPSEKKGINPPTTEMNPEPTRKKGLTKEEIALVSLSLARICLSALSDSESYVYLAAVQTLVAISDVCPFEIMPLLSAVIAKGKLDIYDVGLSLSPEQRVKATEALIFIIRRRGDAIFVQGPSLLETMLSVPKEHQNKQASKFCAEAAEPLLIQRETHCFFTGSPGSKPKEMYSKSNEKLIRLNTGGPVFSVEENDVLRSEAMSVVCELVAALDPEVIALHCHCLVKLATDTLMIESSRPVCRSAASLTRELYDSVRKEAFAESGNGLALALVNSKEERMHNILLRITSSDDDRLVDPATQARSTEALQIRVELEAMGVLQSASMLARSLELELSDSKVQAVRRALTRSSIARKNY